MIHWAWVLVAFCAGGWLATHLIQREVNRRIADGRLIETPAVCNSEPK